MADQNQPQPGAQVPETAPKSKTERLQKAFENPMIANMFASVLKSQGRTDSFKTSMIELYTSDDKLQKCEPAEMIKEALKMAVMGLPVNKILGFSWIIAYKKRVQNSEGKWVDYFYPSAQLGYKGYIQLAIRTGEYKHINARVVYEGQLVEEDFLSGEYVFQSKKTSNKIIGYVAHLELHNGFRKTLYSEVAEVKEHAERYSKGYDPKDPKNIWVTNFDDMATKTVLRALLSKWGLLSPELEEALADDIKADSKIGDAAQAEIDKTANSQFAEFDDVTNNQGAPDGVDPATGEVTQTQLAQGDPQITIPLGNTQTAEPIRQRGRPAGSTNKPKAAQEPQNPDPNGMPAWE